MRGLEVLPVEGIPEVRPGDDVAGLVARCGGGGPARGDVVVFTHKVVSKAEGRLVDLRAVEPSALAKGFAARYGKDPRQIEVVLRESRRIVRYGPRPHHLRDPPRLRLRQRRRRRLERPRRRRCLPPAS